MCDCNGMEFIANRWVFTGECHHRYSPVDPPCGRDADDSEAHAEYPHEPGTLYGCPACELNCYCSVMGEGSTPCIACAARAESEGL